MAANPDDHRPDMVRLIKALSSVPFSGPKGKDIRYMKIEREGRVIIIANTDRNSAQALAEEEFGLRESASLLTRFTGFVGQDRAAATDNWGEFFVDHELIASFSEDISHEKASSEILEGISIDSNEMFSLREECPHNHGPSTYIRTINQDRPDFILSYRQMLFAYATTIINNEDNDGVGSGSELPQGFHAILPLLHDGDLLDWGKGWEDVTGAAADFVLQLFLWPSDPTEAAEPGHVIRTDEKGEEFIDTTGMDKEIILFYEQDSDAWVDFVDQVELRFDVPIDDGTGPSLDLLQITGSHDEQSFLRNVPNPDVISDPLPKTDLSPYWGNNLLNELLDGMFLQVSDWAKLVRGETEPPANVLSWSNIELDHVNSFVSNLYAAKQARGEIDTVEIGEDSEAFIIKGMDYDASNNDDNKPKLWLRLLRAFSHLQVARFYCASLKCENKDLPTLGSTYISYSGYEDEIDFSLEAPVEVRYEPDLHDRPLSHLVDFIMDNKGENFETTVEDLRESGLDGDDRMVIYEHIIQAFEKDDETRSILTLVPFDSIKEELKIRVPESRKYNINENTEALQELLLKGFGYPDISEIRPDVPTLEETMQKRLEGLPYDLDKCLSEGSAISREIEWYLQICVRGAIREFAKSEDVSENMKRLLEVGYYDLSKRSLGDLVNTDLYCIMRKYLPEESYFKQKLRDDLVKSRNTFGHPAEDTPHLSKDEANKILQTLLDSAIEFISLLDDSEIPNPIPIVIKSVKSTKHGYYEIEAVSSSGPETIYIPLGGTSGIEPGDKWYLIPHSNPIRIEPLLFKG